MSRRVAFFDVDGTLIRKRTMFDFQEYYLRSTLSEPEASREIGRFRELFAVYALQLPREQVNRNYYSTYRGRSETRVRSCVESWYAALLADLGSWRIERTWQALAAHRKEQKLIIQDAFTLG